MTTPTVGIAIVAHPQRMAMAHQLANDVDAEAIALDNGLVGCKANHIQAWTWLRDGNTEWSCVLEDDAVPVQGFRSQLTAALPHAPSPVVSLYLGRGRPLGMADAISRVIAADVCWIASIYLLHGVGVVMRTELVSDMLEWVRDTDLPIDESISQWCQQRHYEIAYSRPSLIDHRDGPTVMDSHPSGYPEGDTTERTELRKAWLFGSRDHWDSSRIQM